MAGSYSSLAILGGTFNPPHYGHIQPALAAIEAIGIQKLGLMPCKVPPHKLLSEQDETHRVRMTELACTIDSRMYAELCELELPAPSYSVKSLQALRCRYPQTALFFLMGEDSFHHLTTWHEWKHLTDYCHLVVMRRKGLNPALPEEQSQWLKARQAEITRGMCDSLAGHVFYIETPYFDISSTHLRAQLSSYLQSEKSLSGKQDNQLIKWLPEPVFNYIITNRLYNSVAEKIKE